MITSSSDRSYRLRGGSRWQGYSWTTEWPTRGNGRAGSGKAMASRCGQMVQGMWESGGATRPTVKESSTTPMEMSTRGSGSTTRPAARALIRMPTGLAMWGSGCRTSSTALGRRPGRTERCIRENTEQDASTDRGCCVSWTRATTRDSSAPTRFTGRVLVCLYRCVCVAQQQEV